MRQTFALVAFAAFFNLVMAATFPAWHEVFHKGQPSDGKHRGDHCIVCLLVSGAVDPQTTPMPSKAPRAESTGEIVSSPFRQATPPVRRWPAKSPRAPPSASLPRQTAARV